MQTVIPFVALALLVGAAPVVAASHTLPIGTVLPVTFETTVSSVTD
ncbi:MAG TPA: hypothetical protein VEQ84_00475 [Vicinamibacteria bacterium]|nr:hypothetical protein [Vicinamibacteria bacterium]